MQGLEVKFFLTKSLETTWDGPTSGALELKLVENEMMIFVGCGREQEGRRGKDCGDFWCWFYDP